MYNIYFLSCPVSLNQIAQFHLLLHCLMMSKSCITCWMLVVPFVLYEDILKKNTLITIKMIISLFVKRQTLTGTCNCTMYFLNLIYCFSWLSGIPPISFDNSFAAFRR